MTTIAPSLVDFQEMRRRITAYQDRRHNIGYINNEPIHPNDIYNLFNPINSMVSDNAIQDYNNIIDNIVTDMINDTNYNNSNIDSSIYYDISSNVIINDPNIDSTDITDNLDNAGNLDNTDNDNNDNDNNDNDNDNTDNDNHDMSNLFSNIFHPEEIFNLTRNQQREINRLTQEVSTLTEHVELLSESAAPTTLCAVCMTHPRNYANSRCGHLCVCANCIVQLGDTCPICRASGRFIRIISS